MSAGFVSVAAARPSAAGPRVVSSPQPVMIAEIAKRAVDIGLSVMALIVTAPLLVLVAMVIAQRGPVLFVQTRVGRGDTRFRCYKFRTMHVDAEARLALYLASDPAALREWSAHQKLLHDPRVTAIGRILRKTSVDELPQLINVLRGEMSLVGPRPIIAPEISGYGSDAEYYRSAAFADYALCRPGITGLWQVSGRHRTTHAERRRLDRAYASSRSFWLDALILVQTVGVVLSLSGR